MDAGRMGFFSHPAAGSFGAWQAGEPQRRRARQRAGQPRLEHADHAQPGGRRGVLRPDLRPQHRDADLRRPGVSAVDRFSSTSFSFGMIMSVMPMETPALVASRKPSSFSRSSVSTVPSVAGHLVAAPDDIARAASCRTALLKKPTPSGQISLKITRPAVVSMTVSVGVAVDRLLAEVGILEADAVVRP